MQWSSLRSQLLLIYVFLGVLGLGGLIVWTGMRLQAATVAQTQHDLEQQAEIVASTMGAPLGDKGRAGSSSFAQALFDCAQSCDGRLTIYDAEKRIVFSSESRVPVGTQESWAELSAANSGQGYSEVRWDEPRGERRLFVAAPISGEDGALAGYVQLSIPMATVYDQMRQTWVSLLAAGGVLLALTAVVSLLLARQIARPIQSLTAVIEALAAGDLAQEVQPSGPDEIRRLALAFNRMAQRVRDTLARQNAFVGHAAHELRSPLTGLRLRIEVLQGHCQGDPELSQRYLAKMEHEVDHLRRLVDHLLALSTLDAGASLEALPLDLAPLLYALADEMAPLAQEAGLRLSVDVPAHLPPVAINADQIRAVVRNLLDNASKYTPRGGTIALTANQEGSGIAIVVADTGIGISAESLPFVFDRFYRVDTARSRQQGGAGLGLALVKAVMEAHGGGVQVQSKPGEGSVFRLWLPGAL
jgi:signal transduction histidine kinase